VVSNGVLAIVAPNNLATSPTITLAGNNAVLDALQIGVVSNFTDINGPNSVIETNGTLALAGGQALNGFGTILASNVTADATTAISVGLSTNVVGNLIIRGVFVSDGIINLKVGHITSAASDRITSTNMLLNGVINVGVQGTNDLVTGDTFQLFSGPVNGPATNNVTLPAINFAATISYVWTNKLSIDGTVTLLVGGNNPVNTNPTNITFSVSGSTLNLSWPSDHLGWTLQTNAVSLAVTNAWFPYPGSASLTNVAIPMSLANSNVFFRLTYP
jgi:hypothetical protein